MSNELLDFRARENFDFLNFPVVSDLTEEEKSLFKVDCERVLGYAHATVQNMCLLGARLLELKNSNVWQSVVNPKTGVLFFNHTFAEFCEYAFGFSSTKTSDFLRIAQFVQITGDNVDFIERRYAEYNTSQLIELAAVPPEHRVYFSAEMTREEMRIAKDYVKNSAEFIVEKKKVGFDLLAKAQEWKNDENGRKTVEAKIDVIPGQIELEDITDSCEVQPNPLADLASAGEEEYEDDKNSPEYQEYLRESEPWIELTEEKKELAIKITLIDRAGDIMRKRIYEKYKENPTHSEFASFIKDRYGNSGFGAEFMGETDYKGYKIHPYRGDWIIFLSWAQVASRIVTLINRGEYYTEDDERIEQAREAAHKAGIPFYEGDAEEFNPYVYDGKMSVEDYKLLHEQMESDKESDDYDELDEAQADMQTIEEESERSLPPVVESPISAGRNGVRARGNPLQMHITKIIISS